MFQWKSLRYLKFEKIKKKKKERNLPGFSVSGLRWDNIANNIIEPL